MKPIPEWRSTLGSGAEGCDQVEAMQAEIDALREATIHPLTREELVALVREAGMVVYEGDQDRVLFDGSILEALGRLVTLARSFTAKPPEPA